MIEWLFDVFSAVVTMVMFDVGDITAFIPASHLYYGSKAV
jgi:hypothetical protein